MMDSLDLAARARERKPLAYYEDLVQGIDKRFARIRIEVTADEMTEDQAAHRRSQSEAATERWTRKRAWIKQPCAGGGEHNFINIGVQADGRRRKRCNKCRRSVTVRRGEKDIR